MTERSILLFGLPRSGTTWLGKIFDAHPDTLYRHEPDSVSRLRDVSLVPESMPPEEAEALRAYYRAIRTNQSLKVVGKSPIFPKRYLGPASITAYRFSVLLSRIAGKLGFGLPVYGAPAGDDAGVLVWKSIESLGRLGILLQALPDARALHIVRHPCGFVASVERGEARQRFDDNRGASEDYNLLGMLLETEVGRAWGVSADDLRQMEPEERLAWRWAVFNDKALQDTDTAPALSFAYESLCDDPLSVARDLLDFCGLDWAPQVEAFVASSTSASESTYYSVFKDPRKAAWGWQDELPEPRVSRIIGIAERSRTWQRLYANRDIGARGVSALNEV